MKLSSVLLCALGMLVLATRADAQALYGATAAGGAGELFIINKATGATIQDVGPLNDGLGTNYPLTGLAFNPLTGVLYGSTSNNVAATAAKLVIVNPLTAGVTVIGSFNAGNTGGKPASMGDLAFDALGNLFGVGTVGGANLYSINIATGQATVSGPSGFTGTAGGGLAISSTGVFFGTPNSTTAGGSNFGTYNTTTGLFTNTTNINPLPAGAGTGIAALAFDSTGVLYGDDLGTPSHLITINPATSAIVDLGPSVVGLDALAFRPVPVPEPGTMALLAGPIAIGLLSRTRRRKQSAKGEV